MQQTYNLYQNILEEFGFFLSSNLYLYYKFFVRPVYNLNIFITFNNKHLVNVIDSTSNDKNFTLSYVIFNPLNENLQSCSMQFLNDRIHTFISQIMYSKITQNLIEKSNSKTTLKKWQNILLIVRKKNLINFSFSLKNQNQVYINFEYPLLNILKITTNNLCGIKLEKNEIDSFTATYEEITNEMFKDLFKNPLIVPSGSSQHQYLYAFIKFYTTIKKTALTKFHIPTLRKEQRYSFLIQEIDNLNNYISYELSEELDEFDHESYIQELKIRKESEPDLLLLKDNSMSKDKQQLADDIGEARNNFGYLIKYNITDYQNKYRYFNTEILVQDKKDNYARIKNNKKWSDIFHWQRIVLNILEDNGGGLWYDNRTKKYYFRSKFNGSTVKSDSNELGNLLTRALKEKITEYLRGNDNAIEIVLVSKLKNIKNQKLNEQADNIVKILIFENEIKTIDDDVFDVNEKDEFFKKYNSDLFFTKNRFIPTEYFHKIYNKTFFIPVIKQYFIKKFIYFLVKENQTLSDYVMNWLAYYFQNLQKTKTALVLLGDQEVTQNIFWNLIIKEIFGKKYCTTINDDEQTSNLISDIAKDKLFFNISDIDDAESQFNDKTLALIIQELLIKPFVEDSENNKVDIHGQTIITAKNPTPYLKKSLSKCTVIETANMDTILEKLNIEDETELEDKILEDLDNFSDVLLYYSVEEDLAKNKIDTEARKRLKNNTTSNINKDKIDNNIKTFIQAIKNKNIDYFKKASGTKDKKGNDIYEQLKYAFNKDDGYFIGQDLYLHYNAIYEQSFKDNKSLMVKLKEKDEMFQQEVKTLKIIDKDGEEEELFKAFPTSKEANYKELYKINDYKLAKDIVIPASSTVTSSQTNIDRFSFENEQDVENCIKRTKEYREKKSKVKRG